MQTRDLIRAGLRLRVIQALVASAMLAACSAQQVYEMARPWRVDGCGSSTGAERDACLARASDPYALHGIDAGESRP